MEGKIVGIPRLEDGCVRSPEDFSEWHEANSIQDHAPYAPLHDAFAALEDCRCGAGWPAEDQAALMAVEVEGKPRACRPSVPYLPEHGHAAELTEAISGVSKEVDVGVGVGVWRFLGVARGVECGRGAQVGRFGEWFGGWWEVSRCGGRVGEQHCGVRALEGRVYGALNASFQSGAELRIAARLFAI